MYKAGRKRDKIEGFFGQAGASANIKGEIIG
jgi:hypothetical protein